MKCPNCFGNILRLSSLAVDWTEWECQQCGTIFFANKSEGNGPVT